MDSLFAVKYNLSETSPQKFGFSAENTEKSMTLYENKYALGLAFLTNDVYKNVKFTNLTLDNQTTFLNQLSGFDFKYYQRLSAIPKNENLEIKNNKISATIDKNNDATYASVDYSIEVSSNSQVYVNLPDIQFSNDEQTDVDITVNNVTTRYSTNNVFPFFNIGYFNQAQTISVRFTFPQNSTVSFNSPEFFAVNIEQYKKVFENLKAQPVTVKNNLNTVSAHYQANKDTSLFFTIPYDKGWTAKLNGKPVNLQKAQNGFMKIDVPKGKGQATLTFIPRGLKEGSIASLAGISLFLLYQKKIIILKKRE